MFIYEGTIHKVVSRKSDSGQHYKVIQFLVPRGDLDRTENIFDFNNDDYKAGTPFKKEVRVGIFEGNLSISTINRNGNGNRVGENNGAGNRTANI